MPRPRTILPLILLAAAVLTACAGAQRPIARESGQAIRPPWLEAGPGLRQARAEALEQARLRLWADLMRRELEPGLTLEQAVLTNPALESRLRAEVGSLTPADETIDADGQVTVTLMLDAQPFKAILRRYGQP